MKHRFLATDGKYEAALGQPLRSERYFDCVFNKSIVIELHLFASKQLQSLVALHFFVQLHSAFKQDGFGHDF